MSRRTFAIGLAACGFIVSAYLAAYQLHLIGSVWDPVFGTASSHAVLHSVIDRILPIPDAVFGVGAYLAEVALGWISLRHHANKTEIVYAALALGMALVSAGLVIVQAFVVHHACALCLLSALISWTVAALIVRPAAFRAAALGV